MTLMPLLTPWLSHERRLTPEKKILNKVTLLWVFKNGCGPPSANCGWLEPTFCFTATAAWSQRSELGVVSAAVVSEAVLPLNT